MKVRNFFQAFWRATRFYWLGAGICLTLFVLFFWKQMIVTVHSGELGVKYSRFWGGTDLEHVLGEGVHLIWPFDILYVYDMRIIEKNMSLIMMTNSGLPVELSVTCQYQVDPEHLPLLHQQVGPEYAEKIVYPMMTSVTRQVIGSYSEDDLYNEARQELEDVMMVKAVSAIGRLPITIHNFILENITLPNRLESAITEKVVARQTFERYHYLIQTEAEEAKRKHIEAVGIRNYQEIVNSGMTENYLRFEGIRATRSLAESSNAKLVVTGGKDGLPIIFNSQDPVPSSHAPQVAAPPAQRKVEATRPSAQPEQVPEPSRWDSLVKTLEKIMRTPISSVQK